LAARLRDGGSKYSAGANLRPRRLDPGRRKAGRAGVPERILATSRPSAHSMFKPAGPSGNDLASPLMGLSGGSLGRLNPGRGSRLSLRAL